MLTLPPAVKIFLATKPTDMRKGFGLAQLVKSQLNEDVLQQVKVLQGEVAHLKRDNEQLKRRLLGPTSEKMPPISSEIRRKKSRKKKDGKAERRARAAKRRALKTEQVFSSRPRRAAVLPVVRQGPGHPRQAGVIGRVRVCAGALRAPRTSTRETLLSALQGLHHARAGAAKVVDKSQYGPGFIGHLITSKCADALPLYRQTKQLERVGVPLARSTMTDLFIAPRRFSRRCTAECSR